MESIEDLPNALEKVEEEIRLALLDVPSGIAADRLRLAAAIVRLCRTRLDPALTSYGKRSERAYGLAR